MKKSQMEWKSETESVIARIMGLEQLRPRQQLGKNRRALSDGYVRKTSAICVRNKSLVSIGTKNVKVDAVKDELGHVSVVGKSDERIILLEPSEVLLANSMDRTSYRSEQSFCETSKDFLIELRKSGKETKIKPWKIGWELEKVVHGFKDGKSGIHSKSGYRNQGKDVSNCMGCVRNINKASRKLPTSKTFSAVSTPQNMENDHVSHLPTNQSSLKPHSFGTRKKVARRIDFSEGAERRKAVHVLEPKYGSSCNQFETSPFADKTVWQSVRISNRDIEDEMNIDSGNYESLALANEFSEELSTYSNSSRIGSPEFPENPKRTDQHSPDSVLGAIYGRYYSTDQCFDDIGPQMQLQVLNLEMEDPYSEGSQMGVSEDYDSEEQFSDLPHNGRKIRMWLGDEESRKFSYMVDVLDVAGFFSTALCTDFNMWHTSECPISPSVFEELEKTYGKQASWKKSDRQLLFDYVNFALACIFFPLPNLFPSIKSTLCANMRRDEVEDRLWTMLITEEKEKSKVLSGKSLNEWYEVEEGMNIVYNELATELFDELVEELVQ
ncbi:uncharacterized protein LOC127257683 isoform X2 [Andrographis paniculata]|uniref:uncharacterized protein LOC127257683 isoform X2 n=1 Tax=Andrographis paniculata TaxID=175694 RepID=UPI0021E88841|nr:uncharacterized protein LOC127257683 isoform X2 [Andrographis paniculata]